jgi:hypothetical protein
MMGLFDGSGPKQPPAPVVPEDTHVSFPDDAYLYNVVYTYASNESVSYPHKYNFVVKDARGAVVIEDCYFDSTKDGAFEGAKVTSRALIKEYIKANETPNAFSETITKDNIDY